MLKDLKFWDCFFWIFILFLLLYLHLTHGRVDSDNGIYLAGAWNIYNNLGIYTDFFSFTTPGVYYLLASAWKVVGVSYWLSWGIAILSILVTSGFIFKITAKINHLAAYLAVFLFVITTNSWAIITSYIFCLPFIFSAIYFFVVWLEKRQSNSIYWAGLLAGISVVFMQTIGLATLLSFIIFLLYLYFSEKDRTIINKLVLFCFASFVPIMVIFLKWSPLFLYDNLVKFPLNNYSSTINSNYSLLFFSFFFLFIFGYAFGKRELGLNMKLITLLNIWQFNLLLAALPNPDFVHVSFALVPLLMIFSLAVVKILKIKSKIWFSLGVVASASFMFCLFSFYLVTYYINVSSIKFKTSSRELIIFIKENCRTDYIYAGPFLPGIYFESKKLTPGPSSWLLTNHHPDDYFLETLKKLERFRPDCAVVNYEMVKKYKYNQNNVVDNYIFKNYRVIKTFGDTSVLKR